MLLLVGWGVKLFSSRRRRVFFGSLAVPTWRRGWFRLSKTRNATARPDLGILHAIDLVDLGDSSGPGMESGETVEADSLQLSSEAVIHHGKNRYAMEVGAGAMEAGAGAGAMEKEP